TQSGTYPIEVIVQDQSLEARQEFNLVVANTNTGITFTSDPVTEGTETVAYSYSISAVDDDGDDVTFSLVEGPGWLTLTDMDPQAGTATLAGTPGYEDAGSYRVEIEAV